MGLLSAVLISLVFPAVMLLITVGLGRMEEFLLPHLRAPLPAEGEATDTPSEESRDSPPPVSDTKADPLGKGLRSGEIRAEEIRAEEIGAEEIRLAKARAEAVRRSARRRAYGTPRPVGRNNTGPPRGARTTPLRFR
ncbi:hypothetical protein GCM10011583_06610 [Streptomyces camponoticapitis]|uniref:Uncharacterized protein n=1 Tax=Streptomyces camponoticapitis TaxID=1616125 RepID=A0ABQ2E1Q5_9ACTN|nr:hypothetical protein [Streptomyces camponoticapitis]GGJ77894.1 hypothetical protein GCM10011583_06610 [Streptomyces camponoticapitis]